MSVGPKFQSAQAVKLAFENIWRVPSTRIPYGDCSNELMLICVRQMNLRNQDGNI